ncbi:hypothetical protein FPC12_06960 [Salmonella enterica]|nr:hypothetical protein [Salmonella enterica]
MVQRYSKYGSDNHFIDRHGRWVKFDDYAKLEAELLKIKEAASCLVREASKVYSDYSDAIAPEFVDQQTIYELGILL